MHVYPDRTSNIKYTCTSNFTTKICNNINLFMLKRNNKKNKAVNCSQI